MEMVNIFLKCGQRIAVVMTEEEFVNVSEHVGADTEISFRHKDYVVAMSEIAMVVKIESEIHRGC